MDLPRLAAPGRVAAATLAAVAAFFVATGLWAVHEAGFRYPAWDQFRLYVEYLGRPFPDSVLQLENGHRPIVPALLRVLEIRWFDASQHLQLLVGALLALVAAGFPAWSALNERGLPALARAVVAAVAAMSVFWLANARMLLHGNESVHAYLVVAMVALAGVCGARADPTRHTPALWAGTLAAAVATFSFGPGIAVFPALLMILLARRVRPHLLLVPALGLAACLGAYLFLLPGEGGVRDNLRLAPLQNIAVALRWLASPWVHAWLGLAEPPLIDWLPRATADAWVQAPLRQAAMWLAPAGVLASPLPLAIGALGAVALAWAWLDALRGVARISRTAWIGLAWATFAAATALLIGLGRLEYFQQHPDQLFADRYLVWPCLFWGGLAIHAVARSATAGRDAAVRVFALATLAVAVVLWPTHRAWTGWGEAVDRIVSRSAPAARMGVFDPEVFPDDDSARRHHVEATRALMARAGIGYFAPALSAGLGVGERLPTLAGLQVASGWRDAAGGHETLRLAGRLEAPLSRWVELRLVDAAGVVQGRLMPTHRSGQESPADRLRHRRAGVDGYLRALPADAELRLLVATAAGDVELGRYRYAAAGRTLAPVTAP